MDDTIYIILSGPTCKDAAEERDGDAHEHEQQVGHGHVQDEVVGHVPHARLLVYDGDHEPVTQ